MVIPQTDFSQFEPHPLRRQQLRKKGFKKDPTGVLCTRPSFWRTRYDHWGNPFTIEDAISTRLFIGDDMESARLLVVDAFDAFLHWIDGPPPQVNVMLKQQWHWMHRHRHELTGRLLYCSCRLDQICHADILARWANVNNVEELYV